jgi:hypothetical protein
VRSVRDRRGVVRVRPRRARCAGCGATHVLLPVVLLLRRADAVVVIGTALSAKAGGAGYRRIAVGLGRPVETVRGWLRRFAGRVEAVRELRELVRHRAKLVCWRSGLKASIHAVLAKQGLHVPVSDLFGLGGRDLPAKAPLDGPCRARVDALCRLVDAVDFEVNTVTTQLRARLAGHGGYTAIQAIPGVGRILAAVFVAEIGEVDRFPGPTHLVSWAGLTPKHRESDTTVHRGSITKQGSGLVRWAAVEAAQKIPASAGWLVSTRARIADRRGRNIATVAVARKLLTHGRFRSSSREGSHLPALTDLGVTVSRYPALVILSARRCGPISSGRRAWGTGG